MCVEMWTTEFYTTYGILYELPHQDVPKIFHISVCINAALSAFPCGQLSFAPFRTSILFMHRGHGYPHLIHNGEKLSPISRNNPLY